MCVDPLQAQATALITTLLKRLQSYYGTSGTKKKKSFDKYEEEKKFRHPQTQNELLFITMLCFLR